MIRRIAAVLMGMMLFIPCVAMADEASAADEKPVLVAQLPGDLIYDGTEEVGGGYTQSLATSDDLVNIRLVRRDGAVDANTLIHELYPEAQNVATAEQQPIASYPATRLTFSTGANEDTRAGVLVAFSTDTDTFALAADAPADAWAGDDGYQSLSELWIQSMDLITGMSPDEAIQIWSQSDSEYNDEQPTGLLLNAKLPADAETDGASVMDNGDYMQIYTMNDALVVVMIERRADDPTAQELLTDLYPEAESVTTAEQQPIGSYPAERLTFTTGSDEDYTKGVLIAIHTDAGAFAFAVDIDADVYDQYKDQVDGWISSITFADGNAA